MFLWPSELSADLNKSIKLPEKVKIAHVHLQVSNLERALAFYSGLIGLHEVKRVGGTAYLSAERKAPYLVILSEIKDATAQDKRRAGLFHIAIRFPSRPALANVLLNLVKNNWPLQGASDHLVSEAIYLLDSEGLGVELYRDRPRENWPRKDEAIEMATLPLNLQDLTEQADQRNGNYAIDPKTDIGHVHLQVSNLEKAERFYHHSLGLDVMQRSYPGALFLAAGGYHHHLGANTWNSRDAEPAAPDAAGLRSYAYLFPDEGSWQAAQDRLAANGYQVVERVEHEHAESVLVKDEDEIGIELITRKSY